MYESAWIQQFDGDQMNAIVCAGVQARNECMNIMRVSRWLISPQKQAPLVGAFQDGLIGISEFTKDGITFNKWHAMSMFADIDSEHINYSFGEKTYTNRQLFSRIIPKITLTGKNPSMYKSNYAKLLKYNPADIEVNIVRGELKSGIIDKATSGQDVMGSIFHIIANEYGNDRALETVYNFQLLVHRFFLYHGFTTGIRDINISEPAMKEVKRRIASMMLESRKITQRLNNGKLIAPIGMPLKDFYESEQLNVLATGDDFVDPIFADIDLDSNMMAKLIMSGSKGKIPNFISINGAIGVQTINGKRFGYQAGWGRTSPYFVRYDTEPAAAGFISTSFREGVTNDVYAFMAGEARHGLISNALSTSITGYQNRISVKNLESIVIDNLRKSTKGMNVIQPLYADWGIDPAKTEKVKFPSIMLSNDDFDKKFHAKVDILDKKYQNPKIQELLNKEFATLTEDRMEYRRMFQTLEDHNPKEYMMTDSKQMPVNIVRIIDDTVFNYADAMEKLPKDKQALDPVYAINTVKELCSNLGYAYMNELQRRKKRKLPYHIVTATKLLQILIRSHLCIANLVKKQVTGNLLDIIVQIVETTFKKSLVEYGFSAGIIAAQCISEPMTQYVLDSKHRTGGGGGTKTNAIVRIQEILGAKDTDTMKNPHMLIMPKAEYESDKIKVQEIANHIEMMQFARFVSSTHVFFEEYGKPTHPRFKHEASIISEIARQNLGQKVPGDLARWCIRFGLNKEELILKSMKLETIVLAIRKHCPELFVVYPMESADDLFIRCYIRSSQTKQSATYYESIIVPEMTKIKSVIVRGVKDLIATHVVNVIKHIENPDGSLATKTIYGIYVTGSNLRDILSNPYIDPYRTQSDSVEETERVFGIVATRNKIINEMMIALEQLNRVHCSIFADEMCYSGTATSIQKTGLQKRENANITLRLSFQTPVQVIQQSAINGMTDRIGGVSGPLIMGSTCRIGTTFNSLHVNEDFLKANVKSIESVLDDL